MTVNQDRITSGFRILRSVLAEFICSGIHETFGEAWWADRVLGVLYADQKRDLPGAGPRQDLVDSLDILVCLHLLDRNWDTVFRSKLTPSHRSWAKELVGVRHKNAHPGGKDLPNDYTWRALDTMARLCDGVDSESVEELLVLRSSIDVAGAMAPSAAVAAGTSEVVDEPKKHDSSSADSSRQAAVASQLLGDVATAPSEESARVCDATSTAKRDFRGATLRFVEFNGASLAGADFESADLYRAQLAGAILKGANLKGADLMDADLTNADLGGAHFEETTLRFANLTGASLDGATLSLDGADLYKVRLSKGADLSGAVLSDADLNEATLDGVVLARANLRGASLRLAKLNGASLEGADLEDADLRQAQLAGANLKGANLKGADLLGANLKDAKWD